VLSNLQAELAQLWLQKEASTAMSNNLQAGIRCRRRQGQNAAQLFFLRCLCSENSDHKFFQFPDNYNVTPPENSCSTSLFATVHNKLAGGGQGLLCFHHNTQPT
jgi:hypothetical protein